MRTESLSPTAVSAAADALTRKLKKGQVKTCLIQQGDRLVVEYFKSHKAEHSAHAIHSCTKSVTSLLAGICIDQGLIESIHTPIGEYFGSYLAGADSEKSAITVAHLLTMTSGIDWREFGEWQYWSPMEYSRDILGAALERPLVDEPGTRMNYNSGSTNLLSAIVQQASGMTMAEFAQKNLFAPLAIEKPRWQEKNGITLGANGLQLKAPDFLKVGLLCLRGGTWNGRRIVSEQWIRESTQPRFLTYPEIGHYGYHWWSSTLGHDGSADALPYLFAMGLYGQFVVVVPSLDLVAIVNGNHTDTLRPLGYLREFLAELMR